MPLLRSTIVASLVTACGIFAGARGAEDAESDELTLDQLPAPAREVLRREAGRHRIVAITREVVANRPRYEARIAQTGLARRIVVDERGALIEDESLPR